MRAYRMVERDVRVCVCGISHTMFCMVTAGHSKFRLNRRGPATRRGPSHSDGAAARLCSPQPASLTQ